MPGANNNSKVTIDAKLFQERLGKLAETMAQKVKREGPARLAAPEFVATDIHVMIRQALCTYKLLFYLNADERRKTDSFWQDIYTVVTAPLVRSMIDCLYNVTAILQDPGARGPAFRRSGFKRTFADLDEDQQKYRGRPEWEAFINERRDKVEFLVRASGFTMDQVKSQETWPTLGKYISAKRKGEALTPHQRFLKTFTHLQWREYSALAHGAFEGFIGYLGVGMYYTIDSQPHEVRSMIEATYEVFLSLHLGRAATVLICLITELQAHFRFEGANINERIHKVWDALIPIFEAKELYDERYSELMKRRGILA